MSKQFEFKTEPYQHQLDAFMISREEKIFALLMEMGTGKSKVAIDTAAWLYEKGEINGLLVVAPKSIIRTWASNEIPTHLPDRIKRRVVVRLKKKKFMKEAKDILQFETDRLHVMIINVEFIATKDGYKAVDRFLLAHRAMMVIDESTTIKNHKSMRTKKAIKLGLNAKYKRILTGTPVTQSPLDVYSQFEFLGRGLLGSFSYFGFRNQYAVLRKRFVNGRKFEEVTGFIRLNELQECVKRYSFRALKKDCLDLPEKIYNVRYVEPTDEQKRVYQSLKDESIALLDSGTVISAPLIITQLLRFRQVLCNLAPTEDGVVYIDKSNPRIEEVMDILSEAGDQRVIIWATFRASISDIAATIKDRYGDKSVGMIYGEIKQDVRQDYIDRFQGFRMIKDKETGELVKEVIPEDKRIQYIVMNPASGGMGITLTAATLVIYYDNDWSLQTRLQSEDRAHRIGQKNVVTYIDIVAPGTVDAKIREALVQKRDLAARVTGDGLRDLLIDPENDFCEEALMRMIKEVSELPEVNDENSTYIKNMMEEGKNDIFK